MLLQRERDRILQLRMYFAEKGLNRRGVMLFRSIIYGYYHMHKRNFLWRTTHHPYAIVVSEIMLQQTQTERVAVKYPEFLKAFPHFSALAKAPLSSVLKIWQGMGYNRRAVALQKIAQRVVNEYNNDIPKEVDALREFPGIGKATAGSILAFAYNMPTVFIETNIRRVFIYFFFYDRKDKVHDEEIYPLVEKTLDQKEPRQWYYALMDYGVMLKKNIPNPNVKSMHYRRQSRFVGSNRQIRGNIIKAFVVKDGLLSPKELESMLAIDKDMLKKNLAQLKQEGFLEQDQKGFFSLR